MLVSRETHASGKLEADDKLIIIDRRYHFILACRPYPLAGSTQYPPLVSADVSWGENTTRFDPTRRPSRQNTCEAKYQVLWGTRPALYFDWRGDVEERTRNLDVPRTLGVFHVKLDAGSTDLVRLAISMRRFCRSLGETPGTLPA